MPKKVLIVEDDANIAELLHLYLEKEGFETQVAKDGGKGVELFRSFQPDLVLLDLMLPIMDGWSVLRKIREGDQTPVIMLTAKGETEDKVSGLEQGADDYIVKPFEMKEVLARIHAVLRRSGVEEESGEKKLSFNKLVINLDSYELLVDGQRVDDFPTGARLDRAKPVYEYLPGFGDVSKCRKKEDLPQTALDYIAYLEKAVNCPIKYVSVGAERDAYIEMF